MNLAATCGSCAFLGRAEMPGSPTQVFCRRYPPQVVSVGQELRVMLPNVREDFPSCGEHRPTVAARRKRGT